MTGGRECARKRDDRRAGPNDRRADGQVFLSELRDDRRARMRKWAPPWMEQRELNKTRRYRRPNDGGQKIRSAGLPEKTELLLLWPTAHLTCEFPCTDECASSRSREVQRTKRKNFADGATGANVALLT